ncbi:branched-chain amino acid ABC transporter permease [Leptolinea tardivitalis]|uniref:branched-chain amino acid ABC transporter permease n=1 Tax=Leptolinea tardivitalis TaxID=229920 RepID=UPI00078053DC|nr:branched-chain amino acid ABC transporter permease [Leptolinea tardivitalis]GAP20812.1 amino acid/amide ABC transporter membrane protein 2, HAAT family [Leptolinea tardivitalis]
MELGFLIGSVVKIGAILAYLYGLLWVLGHKKLWVKIVGVVAAFAIVQLAFTITIGDSTILNEFDSGLVFQAASMTMIALGLNLIYGFNGQFSLGQWGFYGIGAYTAADITFRWINGDSRGLLVVGIGSILGAVMILGIQKWLSRLRGVPVLSAFTFYLFGSVLVGAVAVVIGNALNPAISPLLGSAYEPGPLSQGIWLQIVYFLAIIFAGVFAGEVSFLFGLPVLSLGSDYFGIATLGFTIIVNTLMLNSDTILPFPEMKGGRGMIGIPKLTTWFWAFFFMLMVIIIMRNVIHSSTGRTILAVREDETAAKAMGIDLASTKLLTFVIGSFFAGIGGGVYAHYIGFLSPGTFDFLAGFNPLIIVVFGGLGSMTGTIAASFGWIFFLEGLLRVLLGQMGPDAPTWRFVLYPIVLLLLMLIRPQGLLGTVEWGFLKAPFVRPRENQHTASDVVEG